MGGSGRGGAAGCRRRPDAPPLPDPLTFNRLPPAVTVHGLDQARAACEAGVPLTLLSARGAAEFAGALWWRALVAAITAEHPALIAADLLDCAESPGRALQALRVGQSLLILRPAGPVFDDIAERAGSLGATLLSEAPPSLDLATRGATRHLAAWLAGPPLR